MSWKSPIPYRLVPTADGDSFKTMRFDETGLPLSGHPGSFGFVRKNHTHEGVDLYVPEGTYVFATEAGLVTSILPFTGEHAGSPWWHDTWVVMVEGQSGVIAYGEIEPLTSLDGRHVEPGQLLGYVKQVLKTDKGRPMSMLHLELYEKGVREPVEWLPGDPQPTGLLDPTEHLLAALASRWKVSLR